MCLRKILNNAFSTQMKEYKHHISDYIILLGTLSGITCITLGVSMFLFLKIVEAPLAFVALGLVWALFGSLTLYGVLLYRKGRKRSSALILIISGLGGALVGSGFLLGGLLSVFSGVLVLKEMHSSRRGGR